ncbi:amine oxidase [Brevibacillus choshinensis]|uniref:Amine oxidase n=1 Tax=Brevibacillus choshinensis TaxID=54911 RepID=A0ABX7FN99_BRECH|nr:amine oxidase [Brevibacillus choshinensis]QRG67137.1 amine oxidase [Brevibacillus choshinensis]
MILTLFWIFVDLIPFFVAFQVEPPALGFAIGFVLAVLIYLFQKKRFGEVTTIITIKVFYFFCGFWIALLLPSFHLFDFTQLFMYGILTLASVLSLIAKKPFTLQYAKKVVPVEFTTHRLFLVSNFWLTVIWAAAFALSLICSVLYAMRLVSGDIGVTLVHVWNLIGLAATILVRPIAKRIFLNKQG